MFLLSRLSKKNNDSDAAFGTKIRKTIPPAGVQDAQKCLQESPWWPLGLQLGAQEIPKTRVGSTLEASGKRLGKDFG